MNNDTLQKFGFNDSESAIYLALNQYGELDVPKLVEHTGLSRTTVYEALTMLLSKSYIDYRKEGRNAYYKAGHPNKLAGVLEEKKRENTLVMTEMEETIRALTGSFNLVQNKPGVRFFEGEEGIKEVLMDTLLDNPDNMIYTFSDVAGYATHFKEWNGTIYAPKRKEMKIFEKVIIPNDQLALDYMQGYTGNDVTEILFIDHTLYPFKTEINIYGDKVSFVTFSPTAQIGVILENKEIVHTLKSTFLFVWSMGKKYCTNIQPTWITKNPPPNIGDQATSSTPNPA